MNAANNEREASTDRKPSRRHSATPYRQGNKKLILLQLMSPMSFAIFVGVVLLLTGIENPIGWASTYSYFTGVTYSYGITYLLSFVVGLWLVRMSMRISNGQEAGASETVVPLRIDPRLAFVLFLIAAVFQLSKFVNIGSIPLLGDPMSRYKLTLGGFEDYPSRLLAPLSTAFFCMGVLGARGNRSIRVFTLVVGILLNLLMTQRQEVANIVFGCCVIWAFNRRAKLRIILPFAALTLAAVYVIVGVGAMLRYGGGDAISRSVSTLMLPFWIVHAEITVPYVFGEHIFAALNGNILYGLYTFGEFIAIFSPVKIAHGASLMQQLFTDRDTAQSVGAPYSYLIDFGYAGLVAVGLVNAFIMGFYYRKVASNRTSTYWITTYSIVLLSSFWSIRSGISLFYPLVIYILSALFCVTRGGSRVLGQIRSVVRFFFFASLAVSFGALVLR
jgi:oligosaccharide repeat unit polymerase